MEQELIPTGATTSFSMSFSATPHAVRLARRFTEQRLDRWGIPAGCPAARTVALLVGELAANAVRHGSAPGRGFTLAVSMPARPARDGGEGTEGGAVPLRIEVTDARADRYPVPRPAGGEERESGRGLLLVDAFAAAWGVAAHPAGKTVWCECLLHPAEMAPRM
ncbi:ATP-binding protein [Streptomyces sp. NPDC059853]|uniref:ATP-binding protein n=1 Tax=Streptomyces sp. NPDC059853 TaxID=3346973 RepID=UPI00366742B4